MKRRSAPTASAVPSQPIEFLPHQFFLVIVRETPHLQLSAVAKTVNPLPTRPPPTFPRTPGLQFVEFDSAILQPGPRERRLDATHTTRFCRFMNSMRRQHSTTASSIERSRDHAQFGRPRQVHFWIRSLVRGDEDTIVQLLVRWRLLCLHLSPRDALDPFHHLESLTHKHSFVDPVATLSGIAKGVATEILFNRQVLETDDVDANSIQLDPPLTRITRNFIICPCPGDPIGAGTATPNETPPATAVPTTRPNASSITVAQLTAMLKPLSVSMLVKLNATPRYDDQAIIRSGISHLDLSGRDDNQGIDRNVVGRFLESCENAQGLVAVHSSTVFGRAAFCVGCYLIKHAMFTADEAIGWLRFCLPDAVPLWYEGLLQQMQAALQRDGDEYRRVKAIQDETGSLSSRRPSRTTLDDLAISSLRLTSQISIGQIELRREALLGTKDPSKEGKSGSTVASPPVRSVPSGSHKDLLLHQQQQLIATDAALTKRRPVTQGTITRRRLLDHYHRVSDAGSSTTRADFSMIHKFLHQSAPSTAPSSRSSSATLGSTHVMSSRPTVATTPDRSASTLDSPTPPLDHHPFDQ